jgi:hypothetical protein
VLPRGALAVRTELDPVLSAAVAAARVSAHSARDQYARQAGRVSPGLVLHRGALAEQVWFVPVLLEAIAAAQAGQA